MTTNQAELACSRGDDRLALLRGPIDLEPIVGCWRSPETAPDGVSQIDVALRDGQLYARVTGAGPDGPIDWGEVPVKTYSDISMTGGGRAAVEPNGGAVPANYADLSGTGGGPAFLATFDHGFARVDLQCRLYLGLMIVAVYSEFTDGSGRPNYFVRPLYRRWHNQADA